MTTTQQVYTPQTKTDITNLITIIQDKLTTVQNHVENDHPGQAGEELDAIRDILWQLKIINDTRLTAAVDA